MIAGGVRRSRSLARADLGDRRRRPHRGRARSALGDRACLRRPEQRGRSHDDDFDDGSAADGNDEDRNDRDRNDDQHDADSDADADDAGALDVQHDDTDGDDSERDDARYSDAAPAKPTAKRPTVVLQRGQQATPSKQSSAATTTQATEAAAIEAAAKEAGGANNVAAAPRVVAAQLGALAAELSGSAASTQALDFYRIPLFLLPIYQAASVQYGVPWQILAAINEIETDYGTDLSVSTAGAVGWMQFMPSTWLQYGVDALNAGYADPYNPVDAIFAAARYLRAAGAATNLHAAILAYNHSEEYVQSVLLRAKLISSYPKSVIATLTGLTDGRLPISGKHVTWGTLSGRDRLRRRRRPPRARARAPRPAATATSASAPTPCRRRGRQARAPSTSRNRCSCST